MNCSPRHDQFHMNLLKIDDTFFFLITDRVRTDLIADITPADFGIEDILGLKINLIGYYVQGCRSLLLLLPPRVKHQPTGDSKHGDQNET